MIRILAAVLAVALHPAPASAEPLWVPMGFYAAGAAADLHSTYNFLQYEGFTESNPFGRGLSHKPKTLVTVGGAAAAGAVYGLHELMHVLYKLEGKTRRNGPRTGHPRFEKIVLYGAGTVHLLLAKKNYDSVHGRQRRR